FLLCFVIATSISPHQLSDEKRSSLLFVAVIFGLLHFSFEVRQFIWNPKRYLTDIWNCFAYLLPVTTSILLLLDNNPSSHVRLISLSNLILDLKFMLFLRGLDYFGRYFAIILGVAKKVFSFLMILFLIILSFAHAFYMLLKPSQDYTLDSPIFNKNDPNNPWNLTSKYFTYFTSNNSYNQDSIIVQQPDGNTNMFAKFPFSILAIYNLLAGDKGAFGSWQLQNDPYLNQIEKYNINEAFLVQKAKILIEIELLYLLPNQRRWKKWFPDNLSYYVPIKDIRKKIEEIADSNEDPEFLPFITDELRKFVAMHKLHLNDLNNKLSDLNNKLNEFKIDHYNSLDGFKEDKNHILDEIKNIKNNSLKEIKDNNRLLNEIKDNNRLLNELKKSNKDNYDLLSKLKEDNNKLLNELIEL
ncbi:506_t:CDS:2, partial [Entrophospora sp. SA101]